MLYLLLILIWCNFQFCYNCEAKGRDIGFNLGEICTSHEWSFDCPIIMQEFPTMVKAIMRSSSLTQINMGTQRLELGDHLNVPFQVVWNLDHYIIKMSTFNQCNSNLFIYLFIFTFKILISLFQSWIKFCN
jgi:hypothetical protein